MDELAVLIPHYNNPEGLKRSLKSLSDSIGVKPHVYIIDDGSDTFDSTELQNQFETKLKLNISRLSENQGIASALNYGLELIQKNKYTFIARLDAGDRVHKNRLTDQLRFMKQNPDTKLLGSWVDFFRPSDQHKVFRYRVPEKHKQIKRMMNFKNCFVNSSVMFRSSLIDDIGYYPTEYAFAEDYAFFYKIVNRFKTANIPKVLTLCELNTHGITLKNRREQFRSKYKVISEFSNNRILKMSGLLKNETVSRLPIDFILWYKKMFFR